MIESSMGVPGAMVSAGSVHQLELPDTVKEQEVPDDDVDHPTNTKPVIIKIEEEGEHDEDEQGEEPEPGLFDNFKGSGNGAQAPASSSSSAEEAVPTPIEGLREAGLSPFLKKTFEMVEDPGSDAVVSWSRDGRSFVVWDHHDFSKELLPKYFKHSNFSSFIRQLNTYGFRKIDSDHWDFAHEFFQRGKKPLLKNIRRRVRSNHPKRRAGSSVFMPGYKLPMDVKAQTEILKKEQEELRMEIINLRQEQEISQGDISAMEERIRCTENRHQHMFLLLAKAVMNPNFAQQLVQRKRGSVMRQLKMAGPDSIKKRPRLQMPIDPVASEFLIEVMKLNPGDDDQENSGFLSSSGDGEFVGGDVGPEPIIRNNKSMPSESTSSFSDMSEAYQVVSESLLGDSGNNVEQIAEALQDSSLYLEFEGLIRKSQDWEGYKNEFLGPTAVGVMP